MAVVKCTGDQKWSGTPHPAEFSGRDAFDLFEDPGKIVGIFNAAFPADGLHGLIGEAQKLLGVGDPDLQQVTVDGDAELFLEDAG